MRKLRLGVSWWFAQVHGGSWHFIWRELWFNLLYVLCFSPCVFLVIQSCPTVCDPMASSPPASSVRGILQARILEWVANPFLGDLPNPGIEPRSPVLQADSLLSWKEPNAFVFSTLGENKTKMKKCISYIQFCLSARLDFTERNSNEFLLFSLGKAKRGCPAHEVIGMPLNQLWSEISAV